MFDAKTYAPAGPVMKAFHESDAFFRLIAGPIGSSKTTGAGVAEMVFGCMLQDPYPDGVRRAKFGVMRDTYRNLYATFIPSWFDWIPKDLGHFTGSDDRPATHNFQMNTPVGPCDVTVEMKALGANTVEAVCRGWQLHGAYLDEADLMPIEAFSYLAGRVQRGGEKKYRRTRGVWGTFNKPDVDHPIYDLTVDNKPDNLEFFDQPGGLLEGGPPYKTNPLAENLENLDEGYYVISATGQPEWYVRRMIRNKWGASVSGEPIYPYFSDALHVSPYELIPEPRQPLVLGMDGGGTPAAVILGLDPMTGRRICYAEVVLYDPTDPKKRRLATGVGPRRFTEAVRDTLGQRFPMNPVRMAYADPSAQYGADREGGDYSWLETIEQIGRFPVQPAPSNEIGLRHEAVHALASAVAIDGRAKLLINPSCRMLRRGFASDYKWEERDPKQPAKRLKPQKSASSHVHDALQYGLLGDQGRAGVIAGEKFDRGMQRMKDARSTGSTWSALDAVGYQGPDPGVSQFYDTGFDLWRS